jgi:hypothetical protein
MVRVIAEAGDVRVVGRTGMSEVRVSGTACAQDQRDLNQISVVVQRVGTSVRVMTLVPSGAGVSAHADLLIEVPDWMLADIDHEAGDLNVSNVAGVTILDDSGDIDVSDIAGDVDIDDDSGDLQVRDVTGNVWLRDDSGLASVQHVGGGVDVEQDGSGDLFIRNVQLDVWVGEDGSGDIIAEDVRGDFQVDLDTSGSITYRNIGGRVLIPR